MMQQTLRASPSIKKRAKSVKSQRNLGTIKDRKREKKEEKEASGGETILRILRMRYVLSTKSPPLIMSSSLTPTSKGLIRRTTSHSNCRSWRRCRRNRNSGRNGRHRDQGVQLASQGCRPCPKYLRGLCSKSASLYPQSISPGVMPSFHWHYYNEYLTRTVHTIHHFLAPLLLLLSPLGFLSIY
jgi:hypothetical protein